MLSKFGQIVVVLGHLYQILFTTNDVKQTTSTSLKTIKNLQEQTNKKQKISLWNTGFETATFTPPPPQWKKFDNSMHVILAAYLLQFRGYVVTKSYLI